MTSMAEIPGNKWLEFERDCPEHGAWWANLSPEGCPRCTGSTPTRPIVVELIADFMRNPDNELAYDEIPDWRRPDGTLIAIGEARLLRRATLGEIGEALDIVKAEHAA